MMNLLSEHNSPEKPSVLPRMSGFDPTAPVLVTKQNAVALVTRVADRKTLDVAAWLPTLTMGELHALRPAIRQAGVRREHPFVCAACGEPVILKALAGHGHYFSHVEKHVAELAGCPFREGRAPSLEELDRMRYHGQREGERHRRTKELIARTLRADDRFAEPLVESTWRSCLEGWRRPDVRSEWVGLPVVFEAQVSNTYPQVVAERTAFYQQEQMLLVWIFDRLPGEAWRTLHADTFCANQQHLFVVDEESAAESERCGTALFWTYTLCPGVRPERCESTGRILLAPFQEERFELVAFHDLSLDVGRQTACLFEVPREEHRSRHKILCTMAQAECQLDPVRRDIQDILKTDHPISNERLSAWAALVCAIESARFARAVGTAHANAAGPLNLVYDHYPTVVGLLVHALQRQGLDSEAIQRKAWGERTREVLQGRYKGAELPKQHAGSERMLSWLYG